MDSARTRCHRTARQFAFVFLLGCQTKVGSGAPAPSSEKVPKDQTLLLTLPSEPASAPDASAPADAGAPAVSKKPPRVREPENTRAPFLDIDTRLATVLRDLRSIPNPADRERQRYFDVSPLSNDGVPEAEVQVYREALAMLMNSLSRGRFVIAPEAIDADSLIYRVDLRDYQWDTATWNQLESVYPYVVSYDPSSKLFPFDEVTAEQIRDETNTQMPLIQADWFISHASRPPLYYSLLNLPASLPALEQHLGVDIQRNIDTEQVLRAGFANAGPSQNNRVIERHELSGNRGALWISYDFADSLGNKDVFAHALDFQDDSSELIFNLDNGLQGYFIANAAGARLAKAPNNIVQDPAARDGAVEAGLSCMGCHQQDGPLPRYDEIRSFKLNAGVDAQETEQVLALYAARDELETAFDEDQDRYRTARSALGITKVSANTMHALNDSHLGILDIESVASVIGIRSGQLLRAIDASPQSFPPAIVTLRTDGGSIQRDAFEAVVGDLFVALGIGRQLLVQHGSVPNNQDDTDAGPHS